MSVSYSVNSSYKISVPCRGTTFLNNFVAVDYNHCFSHFRPLSGNYISQSSLYLLARYMSDISVPCRGTTFLNMYLQAYEKRFTISVPCRGTTFLNPDMGGSEEEMKIIISVPCRGTTFLNKNG